MKIKTNPVQSDKPERDAKLKAGSLSRFTPPRESPGKAEYRFETSATTDIDKNGGITEKRKGGARGETRTLTGCPAGT
jgi:hypothetical protein